MRRTPRPRVSRADLLRRVESLEQTMSMMTLIETQSLTNMQVMANQLHAIVTVLEALTTPAVPVEYGHRN